jgi:hypothetical protein
MLITRIFTARRAAPVAVAAFAAALAAGLAGCGGETPTAGGTASQAASVQQQARAVWLDFARCARAHGFPGFPDPQVDAQGHLLSFGNSAQAVQDKQDAIRVQGACGHILDSLPPTARGPAAPTAAQLRVEQEFAACMRQHGLSRWPDPRPDGSFPLRGTPYLAMGKTGPVATGLADCRQYETFGGLSVS